MSRVVEEFLSSATIHGLSKAAIKTSLIRRSVWAILLVCMLAGLISSVSTEIKFYFSFPTQTKSYIKVGDSIPFPAVTICNTNQVKNTVQSCADLQYMLFRLSEVSEYTNLPISPPANASLISGDDIAKCVLEHSHKTDMLRHCFWQGASVNCSKVFKSTLTSMGVCYTFNGGTDQKMAYVHGAYGGLRFIIDIQQDQYFFPEKFQTGIKVTLHEPDEDPIPEVHSFSVAPGLSADAVIYRSQRLSLAPPYGNCLDQSRDDFSSPLKHSSRYTDQACLKDCFVRAIKSYCGCRHFYYTGPERYCNHDELINCYIPFTRLFTDNATVQKAAFQHCGLCPPACRSLNYDWSLTYGFFGSTFLNDRLVNTSVFPDDQYMRSNFIELNLYYNSLSEVVVEELPAKNVNDILGNLGGQMGLFMGASILSIVELIEFVCLLITKRKEDDSPNSKDKKRSCSSRNSKVETESHSSQNSPQKLQCSELE